MAAMPRCPLLASLAAAAAVSSAGIGAGAGVGAGAGASSGASGVHASAGLGARLALNGTEDGADDACAALSDRDTFLLGAGRCVDSAGYTPSAFACLVPNICPQGPLGDAQACAIICGSIVTCTGYEIRAPDNATQGTVPTCFVFSTTPPVVGGWPWMLVNGTQVVNNGSGRTVAGADGAQTSCCYKRPYPRSSPVDNPIVTPPSQTDRQVQLMRNLTARAVVASEAALANLTALIDYCSSQFT
jgi:hypothetical protein